MFKSKILEPTEQELLDFLDDVSILTNYIDKCILDDLRKYKQPTKIQVEFLEEAK